MMGNPWFRLYHEFATDPKVQMMSEAFQRRYVMLMCMQCGNVIETFQETERDSAIAFHLRISETEWQETKSVFIAKGFVNDKCELLNWSKRQFESDSSTARVRAYREKKKAEQKGEETEAKRFSNALDTDTDTEKEKNKSFDVSASDTSSEISLDRLPAEKPKPQKPEYPDWFESLWQQYPARSGGNDKRKALHAAQARVKSGKDPGYLVAAVNRYAKFVRANGNWGTQYVMQAATFLGPGEHIDNHWRIPDAANQQHRFAGSGVGKISHSDQTRADAREALERLNGSDGDPSVRSSG